MRLNGKAFIWSTIVVIWIIVAMTIMVEISAPFKAFLVQFAGHHWIGKSIISAAAFVATYLLFRKSDESGDLLKSVFLAVGSVILGGCVIFSFFLWHFVT